MAAKSTKGARDAFMPSSNAFGESRPLVVPDSAKPPPVLQSSELQEKFAGDRHRVNPLKLAFPDGIPAFITLPQCCIALQEKQCSQLLELNPLLLAERDEHGRLPFWLACVQGKLTLLPMLLKAAQDTFGDRAFELTVGSTADWGISPLHHCALNDFSECAGWLIEHSADIELLTTAPDNSIARASTPLMIACESNSARVVVTLIRAGADINRSIPSADGSLLNPLHLALMFGHNDLATFLYQKGARTSCDKRCIKCRMQCKLIKRRLENMRKNMRSRKASEEAKNRSQKELEDAMAELDFVDFVEEMRKIMR